MKFNPFSKIDNKIFSFYKNTGKQQINYSLKLDRSFTMATLNAKCANRNFIKFCDKSSSFNKSNSFRYLAIPRKIPSHSQAFLHIWRDDLINNSCLSSEDSYFVKQLLSFSLCFFEKPKWNFIVCLQNSCHERKD